jgi:adenylosuccinate synthase
LLSGGAQIVARFNGGDNAGHTVVNQFGTFKLRLIPSGISNPETVCILGPGVVINLTTLKEEIDSLTSKGIDLSGRLWVSPRCHVVMPYHPMLEAIYENAKGQAQTGTTRRGMGPVYADKVSYNGIRLFDLAEEAVFGEKLRIQLKVKNALFEASGFEPLDFDNVFQDILSQYAAVTSFVREPFGFVQEALTRQATIVLEGAQAALLDTDWGTYPYSTASTTLAGGACAGLGIAPQRISSIIGVAKAYTTRVGKGPMPTELLDEAGQTLLREGHEYGTVTGRPRRCGWFDAELVRFTSQLNGLTEVALTKLDVLDTLPRLKIGIGYCRPFSDGGKSESRLFHYWEGDARWLEGCQPVYIEMEGWTQSTKSVRSFAQLPRQAQAYVRKIEALIGVPVTIVSVGPGQDEIIRVPPCP